MITHYQLNLNCSEISSQISLKFNSSKLTFYAALILALISLKEYRISKIENVKMIRTKQYYLYVESETEKTRIGAKILLNFY